LRAGLHLSEHGAAKLSLVEHALVSEAGTARCRIEDLTDSLPYEHFNRAPHWCAYGRA